MLRELVRRWLDIPAITAKNDALAQSNVKDELLRMRTLYQVVSADYENTLHAVLQLQQKFDVLSELMGVVIMASSNGEDPKIVSIADDGVLGDAKSYINAAQIIDRAVNIHYQCMKDQADLFSKLQMERRQRKRSNVKLRGAPLLARPARTPC